MKIRMRVEMSGTRNGRPWPAVGGAVEVPAEEGAAYCSAGLAEPVHDDKVETAAVVDDSEKAVASQPKPREAKLDPRAVRGWAKDKGVEVPAKGRIPDAVVDQYKADQAD
jgi:hypothetical protein